MIEPGRSAREHEKNWLGDPTGMPAGGSRWQRQARRLCSGRAMESGRRSSPNKSLPTAAGQQHCLVTDRFSRWSTKPTSGLGSIDILVNNAGVIEPIAALVQSDPAAWRRSIEVNLTGAYHAARAVLR